MIEAKLTGGYIWVKCPWSRREAMDEIPGRKWDSASRQHRFPMDLSVCFALREAYGDELVARTSLTRWVREEIAFRQELEGLLEGDADLARVAAEAPILYAAMQTRKYQMVGARYLARTRAAILGDEPGLGKTLQTLGAVVEADITGPILILAPKTAALVTWPAEIRKWLPGEDVTVVSHLDGNGRRRMITSFLDRARRAHAAGNSRRMWLICNIEMIRIKVPKDPNNKKVSLKGPDKKPLKISQYPALFEPNWQCVVVDESHKALITEVSQYWKQTQVRAGLTLLPYAQGGLRIALSGTPLRGETTNLWGTLNWLRPDIFTSFNDWLERWFQWLQTRQGMVLGGLAEESQADFYRDIRKYMLRRTKRECAPDLPEKMYAGERLSDQNPDSPAGIWLDMDPKQERQYGEMVAGAAASMTGGTLIANGVFAELARLKQLASSCGRKEFIGFDEFGDEKFTLIPELPSNKFDWLHEWLIERGFIPEKSGAEFGQGTGKVILASQFTKLIDLFHAELEKLGVRCHVLTGKTSARKRVEIMEQFQAAGGPRVFLLNTVAGGVSLTLDAADDVIIFDETYIPDDQEQVEDRAHRVSRMHNVTIWYVRSKGTIEETIATTTGDRHDLTKMLLDGSRGVEFARKLIGAK